LSKVNLNKCDPGKLPNLPKRSHFRRNFPDLEPLAKHVTLDELKLALKIGGTR
jgi:hypothetical protein